MECLYKHDVTQLAYKYKERAGECDSLKRRLDDAQDKIRELNKAELASVAALKVERADSRKRIQELEDRCAQLQEEVANHPPCTQQLNSSRHRSYSQASTDAPTMVASLTPPPTPPQAFRRYSTGNTLVCLEAEAATAKAPAKAVTATKAAAKKAATATRTAAVKTAKSIRRAALAMAHMRFHH
ncbi:hypothetical protein EV177_004736 [Coemansia sp. RSA 1804]|nr:hypothetical protein EV177_004736 [Coemansia sp. RSA 1804]